MSCGREVWACARHCIVLCGRRQGSRSLCFVQIPCKRFSQSLLHEPPRCSSQAWRSRDTRVNLAHPQRHYRVLHTGVETNMTRFCCTWAEFALENVTSLHRDILPRSSSKCTGNESQPGPNSPESDLQESLGRVGSASFVGGTLVVDSDSDDILGLAELNQTGVWDLGLSFTFKA